MAEIDDHKLLPELLERMSHSLTIDEIRDLVDAIETVINYRNGFGQITINFERQRVNQIAITSTVKPGVS